MPKADDPAGDDKATSTTSENGELDKTEKSTENAAKKRRRPPPALFVIVAAISVAAYFGYREFQERLLYLHEEDARIHADMITVSSRVAGWITSIAVREGQAVGEKTPLIVIDDREAKFVLDGLQAQLEGVGAEKQRLKAQQELVRKQTNSRLRAERSELSAAQVTISSLDPQLQLAKRDVERTRRLFERKVASRRQLDQSENLLQRIEREHSIAVAKLKGARARVEQAQAERAQLGVLVGDLAVLVKREAGIRAAIRRQQLDLEDRTIESPVAGVVDRKFADVGEYVTPGQRLFLAHDPHKIWIEANIKETEVRRLKVGQPVDVTIDAYPDEVFEGKVEHIGNTATSAFALLPSPNPSGNFTKITQRLPVRIAIAQRDGRLRPGMMVEVKIATSP
ncbi:MAG: HlyD family secretion protein [Rhodospirillaceae bacterium]|nr:HlyD family secretion protein [Rhodospirillaceae bacterium]MBT3908924.1 HlyD family secretion protein [Rhodospirillaceae bacterium]MBT5298769.1 HlyD family secretion protein [Rhodospirillaceae bacterium]MBT5837775.1 HlyD family secretion protein [Rhodospirillaceae bacterium]MBT6609134.1 HlyD family secretion protein [Rhodospirillaceae bacterium]